MNEQLIKSAMSEAKSRANQLSTFMKDETAIKINVNDIIRVAGELEVQIDLILDSSGSTKGEVSGMFLTSPFMATWAKGITYGMRQRYLDAGADPKLAPNAFTSQKTINSLKFSKQLINRYETDFTRFSQYKGMKSIFTPAQRRAPSPVPNDTYKFQDGVGFSSTGMPAWAGRAEGNARKDPKYADLYYGLVSEKTKYQPRSYVLMKSRYSRNRNGSIDGHFFSSERGSVAKRFAINIHEAGEFFSQTGQFFHGFEDFRSAINKIEAEDWQPYIADVQYVGMCPNHDWEGMRRNTEEEAQLDLDAHKDLFPNEDHSGAYVATENNNSFENI
jgi:hypothetical protein